MQRNAVPAAILFDLDETLLARTESLHGFLADQYRRFTGRLGAVAFEPWRDRFLALDRRGHAHKSIVYPALLDEFGGDPSAASALLSDYYAACPRFAQPCADMAAVLTALRVRGMALGIVSNGETGFQTQHVRALGLEQLVDAVLISEAEGLRKPDPALFQRAAERLSTAPERCLFVGDNPLVDVLGAARAGMRTAWFRTGMPWPTDAPPNPGLSIGRLSELLNLFEP